MFSKAKVCITNTMVSTPKAKVGITDTSYSFVARFNRQKSTMPVAIDHRFNYWKLSGGKFLQLVEFFEVKLSVVSRSAR